MLLNMMKMTAQRNKGFMEEVEYEKYLHNKENNRVNRNIG